MNKGNFTKSKIAWNDNRFCKQCSAIWSGSNPFMLRHVYFKVEWDFPVLIHLFFIFFCRSSFNPSLVRLFFRFCLSSSWKRTTVYTCSPFFHPFLCFAKSLKRFRISLFFCVCCCLQQSVRGWKCFNNDITNASFHGSVINYSDSHVHVGWKSWPKWDKFKVLFVSDGMSSAVVVVASCEINKTVLTQPGDRYCSLLFTFTMPFCFLFVCLHYDKTVNPARPYANKSRAQRLMRLLNR